MKREIYAKTLEKEYEIICEVGTNGIDLNSITNEMENIIGYKISSMRVKTDKIYGILVDEDNPVLVK